MTLVDARFKVGAQTERDVDYACALRGGVSLRLTPDEPRSGRSPYPKPTGGRSAGLLFPMLRVLAPIDLDQMARGWKLAFNSK